MSTVPARFLLWAESLEDACRMCGASEEVTNFKVTQARHSGGAIALLDSYEDMTCFLIDGYSDGRVAVFHGYLGYQAETEEDAFKDLWQYMQPGENLYGFDKYDGVLQGGRA